MNTVKRQLQKVRGDLQADHILDGVSIQNTQQTKTTAENCQVGEQRFVVLAKFETDYMVPARKDGAGGKMASWVGSLAEDDPR